MSAAGKQIRGGKQRRSGNTSGAVDGCDSRAAAARRRMVWSEWFWYGARRRRHHGGSSTSSSAAKSLRVLQLRLRWKTTSGYRLRVMEEGGGGLGAMGWRTEEAGVSWLVGRPRSMNGETEGGGELRGNNVSVCHALV